jgi:hypothetical protein
MAIRANETGWVATSQKENAPTATPAQITASTSGVARREFVSWGVWSM